MKKRIPAIALLLALLLSLLGCGAAPLETTANGETTTVPEVTELDPDKLPIYIDSNLALSFSAYPAVPEEYEVVVQRIPEKVDNPDGLPVLKWVCLVTQEATRKWSDMAIVEINQMLADREMPFRLQLVIVGMKEFPTSAVDWTAVPEAAEIIAEADLLYGLFPTEKAEEYLLPITDYVTGDAQPNLQNAVPHQLNWTDTTYGGEIYGIPAGLSEAISNGWCVETQKLKEWGLEVTDFQKNFWEMDQIFSRIYKENGEKKFLNFAANAAYQGTHPNRTPSIVPLHDYICSMYQCDVGGGFALDVRKGVPVLVDLVETEDFRLIQSAGIRYIDAGFAGTPAKEEKLPLEFCKTEGTVPYTNGNYTFIPVTESFYYNYFNGVLHLNGIAANTSYAAEAVQLLSLIAEDEAFRDQLCFGKEGRDYKNISGIPVPITENDGSSYSARFLSPLQSFSSRFNRSSLEDYREKLDGITYTYYPITFDFTGLESELKTRESLLGTFYSQMDRTENEIVVLYEKAYVIPRMDENGYERMLQLVKDAKNAKILAALQEQLDKWMFSK